MTTPKRKDLRHLISTTLSRTATPVAVATPMVLAAGSAMADFFPTTSEFIINADSDVSARPSNGGNDAVAMDADGNFVAVWTQYYYDRGSSGYVGARVFNADGSARTGNLIVSGGSEAFNGAVAMDDDGDFVVVWNEYNYVGTGNGQNYGVFAQRFNSSGVPQGGVITITPSSASDPTVAMDADGDFVVAWESLYYIEDRGSTYSYIVAQRFNASGAPQGGAIAVSTNQGFNPSVAMDDDGDFAIVWADYGGNPVRGNGAYYVGLRLFNSSGAPTTGVLNASDVVEVVVDPAIAMDADGDIGVAWASGNYGGSRTGIDANRQGRGGGDDIRARLFTPAGAPKAPSFIVQTSGESSDRSRTSIAMDDGGDFAVVWASYSQDGQDDYDAYVRVFNADGTPDPDNPNEVRVNQTTEGDQEDTSVAMDRDGDFVVIWSAGDGDPYAIIGGDASTYDVGARLFARQARAPLVIPTLSGVGLTLMGGALVGMGAWHARRRRKQAK